MANDPKTCPSCGKTNPADAVFCCYCGGPVLTLLSSRTTIHVQSQKLSSPPGNKFTQLISQSPDSVVIQILGHEKPVVASGSSDIVLGRFSPGDPSPTVDLTPYHGSLMGVSRQHAIIKRDSTGYCIQDIGSTNGTWLNEEKLTPYKSYPIHSGDLIRLGQLGINAHFKTEPVPQSNRNVETILSLESSTAGYFRTGVLLETLESKIVAYLRAVVGIQSVINQLLNVDSPEVRIHTFSVNSENATLDISLTGVQQAVEFLNKKHIHSLADMPESVTPPDSKIITSEQPTITLSENNGVGSRLQTELSEFELAFTMKLLELAAPHLTSDERKPYVDKLLPHMHAVTSLPLRIADL